MSSSQARSLIPFAIAGVSWMWMQRQMKLKHAENEEKRSENEFQSSPSSQSSRFKLPSSLKSGPYSEELKLAIELALRAGSNMVDHCDHRGTTRAPVSRDLGIQIKGGAPENFCTQVDLDNEKLLMEGISAHFPNHAIIGEEATGNGIVPKLSKDIPTWILDPVDGTTNFAAGLPLTCVSVGLCDKGRPVMGCVYAPMTQELYVAIRGRGAFRNGCLLNNNTNNNTKLKDAVVDFEFGYARDSECIAKMVGAVQKLLQHGCRTTRSLGSGVLDLCYVATGRIDVVYTGVSLEGWKPWDYCAAMVIVRETGACIEALHAVPCGVEEEFDIYSSSMICAVNQELLEECRAVVCS